jgi:hypothetical protein
MAKSRYSALGLPDYLFQKQSSISKQTPPNAPFSIASAIGGGGGFVSQTAPNQQPQKKKIYFWIEHDKGILIQKEDKSTIKEIADSFIKFLKKDPRACNLRDLKKILENQETLQNILNSDSQEAIVPR